MLRSVRRAAALVAAPALATIALVAVPTEASAATDPAPVGPAATWLNAQLTGGIVHNDEFNFDDIGLTADVALGLHGLGGHASTVSAITAAVEPRAHDEWYTSTFEGVTTTYAGSLAKAAVLAQAAGTPATDFGGHDLIAELAATVSATGATAGRVQDTNNAFGDTNTFGQAYAAQALAAAGNAAAAPVTSFLLQQQCAPGWFRLDLAKRDAADQTCSGDATSVPDTDATAIAVLALAAQKADPTVAAKLAVTKTWLQSAQKGDGSFGGGPTTEAPNANSTGLAGTALAALGDTVGAAKAAGWVRGHQVTNVASCSLYATADIGSIAYDDAALTALASKPIDKTTQDKARRATAQALPVLQWAPAGTGIDVVYGRKYIGADTSPNVGVRGAAPGEALCATTAGGQKIPAVADYAGKAHFRVKVGKKTSKPVITVSNATGVTDKLTLRVLGPKKLRILSKSRVRTGTSLRVVVGGLAPGEIGIVRVGPRYGYALANSSGRVAVVVKVTGRPRTARISTHGQYGYRSAATTVRVVR